MSIVSRFLRSCALIGALLCGILSTTHTTAAPVSTLDPAAFSCNLPAPGNLHVTGTTTSSISVDWDDVTGASGYLVTAKNTQTGTTYYTATPGSSFDTATGLPAATSITITVQAICGNGIPSTLGSDVVDMTNYIVVDDIVAFFPTPQTPVGCSDIISDPECLALRDESTGRLESFRIILGLNNVGVGHQNEEPGEDKNYRQGWYFGNETNEVPFNQNEVKAHQVFVYYVEEENKSLGCPIFVFEVENTDGLRLCRPSQLTCNGNISNNDRCTIWQSTCSSYESRSTATSNSPIPVLRANPNPFTDVLQVELERTAQASLVQLMDTNGRLIHSQTVEAGTQTLSIGTETLAPGLYLLRCQNTAASKTIKVVKAQ